MADDQEDPMVHVDALPDGKLKDGLVNVYTKGVEVVNLDAAVHSREQLDLVIRAITTSRSLTSCGLRYNMLDDEGARALGEAVSCSTTRLEQLYLTGNDFSAGAKDELTEKWAAVGQQHSGRPPLNPPFTAATSLTLYRKFN